MLIGTTLVHEWSHMLSNRL